MTSNDRSISDSELKILEVLWNRDRATVREITAEVYEEQSFSKYQTVQKLLERLEKKGCVKRKRGTPAHTFEPTVERDDIIGHRLEQVAEKLCGGSLTPLLMHLAGRTRLKPNEREAIQKLINSRKR
ncbi:MAG: BlaI/MecI/CopY family transcriptional regulator [Planctomycetota bacterium]